MLQPLQLKVILFGFLILTCISSLSAKNLTDASYNDSIPLKTALINLQNNYQRNIIFEDNLVAGLMTSPGLIITKDDLESNLKRILTPLLLDFRKYNDQTYLILRDERLDMIQLSGIVTDQDLEPAIGVTVRISGTDLGTVTDESGKFMLRISKEYNGREILFSSVGYLPVSFPVSGSNTYQIKLSENNKLLDNVVIVGYGEQKRSNISGSVTSVNTDDLNNKSRLRLDQALQGLAAGVTVTQNGGAPGAAPSIHIRGIGSISGTEPLWIIDGVRMEPGNYFDINDVQSIEVLKDASASAVYGAKAAHGVILVTTKRGKGALLVNVKSSIGKRSPIRLPELLNSADFVKYKKESRLNAGQNPEPSWDNYTHDTDWMDAFYDGSGWLNSNSVSISKGDEKMNYYISFGNDTEKGILIDNDYKRYSARINSDLRLNKWLTMGENILLSRVTENPIGNNNENYTGAIPYRSIPIMPVYDDTNPYGGWGRAPVYFQGPNPVATQYQQHEVRNYNRVNSNVYLQTGPFYGITLRGTVGLNYMSYNGNKFDEAFDYGAFANPIAQLTYSSANDQTLIGNLVATWTKTIGRHDIKLMGGYEASKFSTSHFNLVGSGFPVDIAASYNLSTGAINTTDRFNVYESRYLSQFGRLNYSFKDRYIIEANIRRDASAPKFGPSNIWGVFPSFSAAWRISEEPFFKHIDWLTNVKLRASTGKLGSDNIGDYIYLKTYTSQFSTYAFDQQGTNKVSGFYISKFPNGDVKWEEVNMHNIGLDLRALKNKLSISTDFYIKNTTDLLYAVPIPASVGISVNNFDPVNPEINIGSMRNTGVDLDVSYSNMLTKKMGLTIGGNVSYLKNKMISLNEDQYITGGYAGGLMGGMTRTQPGLPVSSFYGFVVQQMLNSESDVYAINTYASDGFYQETGTGPGDLMYKDLNGDGDITAEDRTVLGNPWPKWTYALNMGLDFAQQFDLAIQFQGVQDVDIFNANKAYSRFFFGDNNSTTDIFEAWTSENHTEHPRNIASDPNGNFSKSSSYFVEDGSYLKLRNVQLGYNVPMNILNKIRLKKARFYFNANNLLTITGYSGLDPEIAGTNISRGVDYGIYPQVRTYSGGIEIQF